MEINGMRSTDLLSSIYAAAYSPPMMQGNGINSQSGSSTEKLEISGIGNLMNAVSQMSSSDQATIQSFMEDLTSSVQNGSFDASTMADSAPSALTSYAEENGIDLTQLVQDLAEGPQNNPGVYGPPPPPPPMMADQTGAFSLDLSSLEDLSDTDKTEVQSFLSELTSSVQNGTFDASTMAAEAPDALATLAEENGIDLTELVQDMADGIENNKNAPPPPPPPMMADQTNMDLSSLANLGSSEKTELESFLEELTSSVLNGNFDASTMAAEAPDSLAALAEANGIDLTTLLQDLASGIVSDYSSDKTSNVASA